MSSCREEVKTVRLGVRVPPCEFQHLLCERNCSFEGEIVERNNPDSYVPVSTSPDGYFFFQQFEVHFQDRNTLSQTSILLRRLASHHIGFRVAGAKHCPRTAPDFYFPSAVRIGSDTRIPVGPFSVLAHNDDFHRSACDHARPPTFEPSCKRLPSDQTLSPTRACVFPNTYASCSPKIFLQGDGAHRVRPFSMRWVQQR